MPSDKKNHRFEPGTSYATVGHCTVCGKKRSHVLHRLPKFHYAEGEVVGRYFSDARGVLRRLDT